MKKMWLFLFLIVQSCYLIPCTFNSDLDVINEQITAENVSGIYKIEKRTIDYVKGYENSVAYIELKPDGNLIYSDITNHTLNYFNIDTISLVSGIGTWEIKNKGVYTSINRVGNHWKLFKKNDNYVISQLYGDPDDCLFTRFIKETK
ncbi:MAG: hypothetical protein AB8B52_11310 [Winogradskyella sp.]|uniref:hypothetical protein n=1 Tax=Winogradskyella sp. TaxID=1883156 RepID=UPI00385C393E